MDAAAADLRGSGAVDGHPGGAATDITVGDQQPTRVDVDHWGFLRLSGWPGYPQGQPADDPIRGGGGHHAAISGNKGDLVGWPLADQFDRLVEHDRPLIHPGADQDPIPRVSGGHGGGHRGDIPPAPRVDDVGRRDEGVAEPAGQIGDQPATCQVGQRREPQLPPVGVLASGQRGDQVVGGA